MKPSSSLIPIIAAIALLPGCTTTTTTASRTAQDGRAHVENTGDRRSYSQEELQKRGQSTVGGALEAQDASVRTSGGR